MQTESGAGMAAQLGIEVVIWPWFEQNGLPFHCNHPPLTVQKEVFLLSLGFIIF